jgi:ADP-ribosylglycohydrolase
MERLGRELIARRYPRPLRQCLFLGRGALSDDTEHAFLTARALAVSGGDPAVFARALARRLRWWFAALPPGIGMATARACIRLWCGFSPERSGVWSAGNGPSMRAAIIGAYAADDGARRAALVAASTLLTHRDPKALVASRAVADTAALLTSGRAIDPVDVWEACGEDEDWRRVIAAIRRCREDERPVADLAVELGCAHGVSGYSYHSVPVALYGWLRHRDDARAGLEATIRCGGDTDTTAAVAGALYGIELGEAGLPAKWLSRITDFPLSLDRLRAAGAALADPSVRATWCWPLQPTRNFALLLIVLAHGFRRMLP